MHVETFCIMHRNTHTYKGYFMKRVYSTTALLLVCNQCFCGINQCQPGAVYRRKIIFSVCCSCEYIRGKKYECKIGMNESHTSFNVQCVSRSRVPIFFSFSNWKAVNMNIVVHGRYSSITQKKSNFIVHNIE